jgi:hypothetical protein
MSEVSYQEIEDLDEELTSDEELEKERQQRLNALGLKLSESRSEAIDHRQQSGIEDEWLEDEEHYQGIDDENRSENTAWNRKKPLGQVQPSSSDKKTGSTIFFNITRPYCDAASARVADMLLPTDDRGWAINCTPIPEMEAIAKGNFPRGLRAQIKDAAKKRFPNDLEAANDAAYHDMKTIQAEFEAKVEEAKEKAKRAERRIDDWHVECQFHAEMRKVIEDTSIVGNGVLKGPFTKRVKKVAFIDGEVRVQEDLQPISKRINYWNLFPAPGCGESIHDGDFIWERDDITKRRLRRLKGTPGYIDSAIDEVLEKKPCVASSKFEANVDSPMRGLEVEQARKSQYEIWYYHGIITKQDLLDSGYQFEDGEFEEMEDSIDGKVTMINNIVIHIDLNLLDTGEFPYDVMVWQRRTGMPWGVGVARQVRTPQVVVNEAGRHMMDNAGFAAGPQQLLMDGVIPEDGIYEMKPWKQWHLDGDLDQAAVQYAFQYIYADMQQGPLQAIIELGLRMAEDVTGLPMIMQGQTNARTPNTLGGMQIQNNNGSTVLRRIARTYDDRMTEPHVRRYYAYLLQYGDDDSEKGDFSIDARGSSALVERDQEVQSIMEFYQVVMNPVHGLDPKKWAEEALKSRRIDPKRLKYDDDKWQETVERMTQPPADPRIEIAQMKMESEDKDREMTMALKEIDVLVDQFKEDKVDSRLLQELKTKLSDTVMKLNTQKQLSGVKSVQAITPPTEPAGRAPNGEAYSA